MKYSTQITRAVEERPLSYMERFATGWGTPIAHFTFSGPFTRELIVKAMGQVRRRNPLLRCCIRQGHLVATPPDASMETPWPVTFIHTTGGSRARFEQAARCAWEGMGFNMVPENLWQMTFFHDEDGCEMVFNNHHSILDGMSWFSIVRDFLRACEGETLDVRPLSLPMESVYPEHARKIAGLDPFVDQNWLDTKGTTPVTQPIYTQSVLVHLPESVVVALKNQCRVNGTSLHGALMAAYLLATDNALPKLYSDVSTRRWCTPPLESTYPGIFIGQIVWETYADPKKPFWHNARRLLDELKARIDVGAHLSSQEECSTTAKGPEILNITTMAPPKMPRGRFALEAATLEFAVGTSAEIPRFPVTFSVVTLEAICSLRLHYHKHFWTGEQATTTLAKLVRLLTEEVAQIPTEEVSVFAQP